jgi:PAS domain S-box-containing protein
MASQPFDDVRDPDRRVAELSPGEHLCLVCDDPKQPLAVAVPYLVRGLERDEHCIYLAVDHSVEEVSGALAAAGVAVERERERGTLSFYTKETLRQPGPFDPHRLLEFLQSTIEKSLAAGYTGVRMAMEMTWAPANGVPLDRLVEFEATSNTRFFAAVKGSVMCLYDRRRFPARVLEQVLRAHPFVARGPYLHPNVFYEGPDLLLGTPTDEQRLNWILDKLARTDTGHQDRRELILEQAARTRAEAAERRFRELVQNVDAIVWEADALTRRFTFVSQRAEPILGYPVERWLTEPDFWMNLIHPTDRERCVAESRRHTAEGRDHDLEYRALAADGREVWLRDIVRVARGDDGLVAGLRGLMVDMTERKRGEAAREQYVEQLRLLYHLTDILSRPLGPDDVYEEALFALQHALGAARAAVLLCDDAGVMRFKAWRGLSADYRAAVEGHSPWPPNAEAPRPVVVADIEKDPGLESLRPVIRTEGIRALAFIPMVHMGRLLGKFMLYYNVPHELSDAELRLAQTIAGHIAFGIERASTEALRVELLGREREARREAEIARAEAEAANRAKDDFLAVLSHELRTPLTAILGWARVLRTRQVGADQAGRALESIERNTRLQKQIIDDLLDSSSIVAGKLQIERRFVDLAAVVTAGLEMPLRDAESNGIKVRVIVGPALGRVWGDPVRLQQVVANLAGNAVKFTPAGGTIEVRLERHADVIRLTVHDTGVGIDPLLLPHIFDRFQQGDSTLRRRHGGLGLGLAIVRSLVELHGGRVRAESAGRGHGATFIVDLPAATGDVPGIVVDLDRKAANSASRLASLRILVVDDHDDTRELIGVALSQYGADVRLAASVAEARAALEESRVDVVVSDLGLPGEDGYDLLRSLQAEPGGGPPAIALSAHAGAADREQALAAGFILHLAKPVDPQDLMEAVANTARTASAR